LAASISVVDAHVPGAQKEVILDVTPDTSYPTGGYAITPPGISRILLADVQAPSGTGHTAAWDYTNKKLKFFTTAGTEVPNATNIATAITRIAFLGYA
jgi:hypothetical protein